MPSLVSLGEQASDLEAVLCLAQIAWSCFKSGSVNLESMKAVHGMYTKTFLQKRICCRRDIPFNKLRWLSADYWVSLFRNFAFRIFPYFSKCTIHFPHSITGMYWVVLWGIWYLLQIDENSLTNTFFILNWFCKRLKIRNTIAKEQSLPPAQVPFYPLFYSALKQNSR